MEQGLLQWGRPTRNLQTIFIQQNNKGKVVHYPWSNYSTLRLKDTEVVTPITFLFNLPIFPVQRQMYLKE